MPSLRPCRGHKTGAVGSLLPVWLLVPTARLGGSEGLGTGWPLNIFPTFSGYPKP